MQWKTFSSWGAYFATSGGFIRTVGFLFLEMLTELCGTLIPENVLTFFLYKIKLAGEEGNKFK